MGSYCFCDGCDELLEASPDLEGMSKEFGDKVIDNLNAYMRNVWGDAWVDVKKRDEY